ncbi:predicted protein [Pyrenophora tritici-repentis Pt-1C-BFP]|uniref:Alpha/beta hydrolase fold-3 domain-containing protein n=1 Tax=Pyrenophora tritici-repentis (strain Pt-1C-BFP) TaxID=426418 RepID=B2WL15_PYRTR|nr:uncharacterized protein PTRG_10675 [Pyrenophora tritici-repentis Pt-1C-BFP]EDU43725.1 predicted protein [Pyrenophora tritici-repentis Pt-1C-BFP]
MEADLNKTNTNTHQCTGTASFHPWFSTTSLRRAKAKHAIIISVNYPLGPKGTYTDIYIALQDFLLWYKHDGSFDARYESWPAWLLAQHPQQTYTIDKSSVYVEAKSAGTYAAVTTLSLNAKRDVGTAIPINAALFRSPMLAHYKRDILQPDAVSTYMGHDMPSHTSLHTSKR